MPGSNCEEIFGQIICDELQEFNENKFLKTQDEVFNSIFKNDDKRKEYSELIDKVRYPYVCCVENCGDHVAWIYFDTNKNLPVVYIRDMVKSKTYEVLDPQKDNSIPQTLKISTKNRYLIIGLFKKDDPFDRYAKIYDIQDSKFLNDEIKEIGTFSFAWDIHDKGFFYIQKGDISQTPQPPPEKVYYHKLGESQNILIKKFIEKFFWKLQVFVTFNGKHLIVIVSSDKRGNLIYFGKMPDHNVRKEMMMYVIVNKWKRKYKYITSDGDNIILLTDRFSPNGCLISVNLNNVKPLCHCDKYWKPIVIFEHEEHVTMYDATRTLNNICFVCLVHGLTSYGIYDIDENKITDHYIDRKIIFLEVSGSQQNSRIYFRSESVIRVPIAFDYFDYVEKKWWWNSRELWPKGVTYVEQDYFLDHIWENDQEKDEKKKRKIGIIFGKTEKQNEKRPCLMIVDAGFGEMNLIKFRPFFFYFLKIWNLFIVIATLPGGGEYGRKWHNEARGLGKKISLKYLKLLAEKLKQTRTDHLILYGERNGGLLATLAIMKLPKDLFSCVIVRDGIMDLIDINKSEFGRYFLEEYGDPRKSVGFLGNAMKFSPHRDTKSLYEKLQESQISVLFIVSKDRIVPSEHQSSKTAAIVIARVPKDKTINLFVYHNPSWYIDIMKPYDIDKEATVNMFSFIKARLNIKLDIQSLMKKL